MKEAPLTLICVIITLISCNIGAGTLGGFQARNFETSYKDLSNAVDTLYRKHPEYKIPDKWKSFDDWKERGYDFLDGRLFYFPNEPEEMYYVTFLGPSISIRAVNRGDRHWKLESETSNAEKKRIEDRLDKEIVSKLEEYTHVKSTRE